MPLMTKAQRGVIVNLHISDQQTRGHPKLAEDEVAIARGWLPQVLTDDDKLEEHVDLLGELYRASFRPPTPRRDRWEGEPTAPVRPIVFTHVGLLAEDRIDAVLEQGPDTLANDELARLLLNPIALYDLADLIRTRLPSWWIEPLAEAGRAVIRRHDLVIEVPEVGTPATRRQKARPVRTRGGAAKVRGRGRLERRGGSLVIGFADDSLALKQRIAKCLYGEPDKDFTLTLHRHKVAEGRAYVVELEASPAPVRENLKLTIEIKGHRREFALEVPPSVRLDPEADVPDRVFARAVEPVPEEAFNLREETTWRDEVWPPHLVLRCRYDLATTDR
jgi:hypothetical protein